MKHVKDYSRYEDIPDDYDSRMTMLLTSLKHSKDKLQSEIDRITSITWSKVSFTLYTIPIPTPRGRSTSKHKFFYVKNAVLHKKNMTEIYESLNIEQITTPMKVKIKLFFPTPEQLSNMNVILAEMGLINHISTPDCDNCAKTYTDAQQDNFIFNDSYIVDLHIIKKYSMKPRIEVTIKYMDEHDVKYNEKKFKKKVEGNTNV